MYKEQQPKSLPELRTRLAKVDRGLEKTHRLLEHDLVPPYKGTRFDVTNLSGEAIIDGHLRTGGVREGLVKAEEILTAQKQEIHGNIRREELKENIVQLEKKGARLRALVERGIQSPSVLEDYNRLLADRKKELDSVQQTVPVYGLSSVETAVSPQVQQPQQVIVMPKIEEQPVVQEAALDVPSAKGEEVFKIPLPNGEVFETTDLELAQYAQKLLKAPPWNPLTFRELVGGNAEDKIRVKARYKLVSLIDIFKSRNITVHEDTIRIKGRVGRPFYGYYIDLPEKKEEVGESLAAENAAEQLPEAQAETPVSQIPQVVEEEQEAPQALEAAGEQQVLRQQDIQMKNYSYSKNLLERYLRQIILI